MTALFPHLDYKPKLSQGLDHGIGIVAAGGIVNYAHLFAHKKIGFRVVGITDRSREQAERTAKEHGIAKVYASLHWLNSFVSFGSEATFSHCFSPHCRDIRNNLKRMLSLNQIE
jgi:hypothetical protein